MGQGSYPKFRSSPLIFLQRLKLETSNLVRSLGLPRPIIKSHQRKSGRGHGLRERPKILGFPYNIFATAEASEFKFGIRFGISKAHHKITPWGKSGRGPGLGELPKIGGSPLIYLQRLKVATSKLAGCWGLPRPIIKSYPEEKERVALG